jgi:ankyrin repeat protein
VLIELGADKQAKADYGSTPLLIAARYGQEAAVRVLIELGADKEAKDKDNRTPLHVPVRFGKEAVNYTDTGKLSEAFEAENAAR